MTCRTSTYPEEAVQIANAAGARFLVPVHHQTFRLSFELFHEQIARFETAPRKTPERIALREIGETFVLPYSACVKRRWMQCFARFPPT